MPSEHNPSIDRQRAFNADAKSDIYAIQPLRRTSGAPRKYFKSFKMGIDIGQTSVKAVAMTSGAKRELLWWGVHETDFCDSHLALNEIASVLERWLDETGIPEATTVAVDRHVLRALYLRATAGSARAFARLGRQRLSQEIGAPIPRSAIAVAPYTRTGFFESQEREGIVVAVFPEAANQIVAILRASGIENLDFQPHVLAPANLYRPDTGLKTIGYLDIGGHSIKLTICHLGKVRFLREIEIGMDLLVDELAAIFQHRERAQQVMRSGKALMSRDEATRHKFFSHGAAFKIASLETLLSAVRQAIADFQNGAETLISHFYLLGGGALFSGFATILELELDTRVEILNPLQIFEKHPGSDYSFLLQHHSLFATAVGAALPPARKTGILNIPSRGARAASRRRQRTVPAVAAAALLLLVIVFQIAGFLTDENLAQLARRENDLRQAARTLSQNVAAKTAARGLFDYATRSVKWTETLSAIAAVLPDSAWITEVTGAAAEPPEEPAKAAIDPTARPKSAQNRLLISGYSQQPLEMPQIMQGLQNRAPRLVLQSYDLKITGDGLHRFTFDFALRGM